MTVRDDYQVSSESAVRHWKFSYARLENTTPTATQPFQVDGVAAGDRITGTVLSLIAADSIIIGDVTHSMVYQHNVRNVLTYNPGVAELTWGVIAEGDRIFYDGSVGMPADVFLSTSPLNTDGTANTLFGHAVLKNIGDTDIPTTVATAATEVLGVMQEGA